MWTPLEFSGYKLYYCYSHDYIQSWQKAYKYTRTLRAGGNIFFDVEEEEATYILLGLKEKKNIAYT